MTRDQFYQRLALLEGQFVNGPSGVRHKVMELCPICYINFLSSGEIIDNENVDVAARRLGLSDDDASEIVVEADDIGPTKLHEVLGLCT